MPTEQERTIKGLEIAIQMEIDGKEYYLKASQGSAREIGKKLLERLAAEEDRHRQKFEQIYRRIQEEKGWPETDFKPDAGKTLRTIFTRASEEASVCGKAPASEFDAVKTALDMEKKSYDFYKSRSKEAPQDTEKNFYEMIAGEEQEHNLVLLDYYEYLKDPAAWFVKSEHPSIDGG